jgi:hypothetical protein
LRHVGMRLALLMDHSSGKSKAHVKPADFLAPLGCLPELTNLETFFVRDSFLSPNTTSN